MNLSAWFERLTDLTSVVRTESMLKEALPELVAELGFDSYAYLYVQPKRTYAVSNYHPDWQRIYFERHYEAIDPVIKAAKSLRAFAWFQEHARRLKTKEERRFASEASDFGIRSGITIPVRTACRHLSMLTLASSKPSLSLDKDIDQIAAVTSVAFLHAKVEECALSATSGETFDLTPRQALCLKWSAEGKSMKMIAAIENMSFATVNFHLNNARKVFDANSLPQATALATKLRLI